jgi:hypothetical protein
MTPTEKRKEKRLAKIYGRLATASLLFWILEWVVLIIVRNHTVGEWKINFFILITIFLAPLFGSLILWTISGVHTSNRQVYKNQIREYRVRVAYKKCMDYINAGDLNAACEIYNDFIPVKHSTRDYLFSVLVVLMSRSDDPDLKKRGEEKLAMLNEFYNSAKINF